MKDHNHNNKLVVLMAAIVLCFISSLSVNAQDDGQDLLLHGMFDDHQIKLRWASKDLSILRSGSTDGYIIKKSYVDKNGKTWLEEIPVRPNLERATDSLRYATDTDRAAVETWLELRQGPPLFSTQGKTEWTLLTLLFGVENNFQLARDLALGFIDTEVDPALTYSYSVVSKRVASAQLQLSSPTIPHLMVPDSLSIICNDNVLSLSLALQESPTRHYVAFDIERAGPSSAYEIINDLPLLPNEIEERRFIYYRDTMTPDDIFRYRARGKNVFGEYGPYSPVTIVYPCHVKYTSPFLYDVKEDPDSVIQVKWTIDEHLRSRVQGFHIYRSSEKFGSYELITEAPLPPNARLYEDLAPRKSAFYQVEALYPRGIRRTSHTVLGLLKDITAPKPPLGLQADFDTSTFLVHLSWQPNSEEDLKGYKVYYKDHADGTRFAFTNSAINATSYVDTLQRKTGRQRIYYIVSAVDKNLNESWGSDSVVVTLPDDLPPYAARITRMDYLADGPKVYWSSSPSDDAVRHYLQVASPPDAERWQTIASFEQGAFEPVHNVFIHENLEVGDTVAYRVVAEDAVGWQSFSNIRRGWRRGVPLLPAIEYYQSLREQEHLAIYWDYREDLPMQYFKLYAGSVEGSLKAQALIAPAEAVLQRGIVKQGGSNVYTLYRYTLPASGNLKYFQIKGINLDGDVTPISDTFSTDH